MIQVKRVYEPTTTDDGARFLVDRLWPRGVKRNALHLDGWLNDVAPSDGLRRWFAHDPKKWEEFRRRYSAELDRMPETWRALLDAARAGTVTLLFGARDSQHNNAVALKGYLDVKLKEGRRGRHRNTSTGQGARCSTVWDVLPSTKRPTPRRREPITIRSA
ncbi:MAG: DUF488 family protein [Nitrospirae bacterium]|nr:DUF488 family protein [Nitrospirota bacterium]